MEHRKPNRLAGYNYSQNGSYFITICSAKRESLFGDIVGGGVLDAPSVQLSDYGSILSHRLQEMHETYPHISVDKYIIMPNHVHFILSVHFPEPGAAARGTSRTPSPTSAIVPQFVSTLKRLANRTAGFSMFQRSYHDHIIRNDKEYQMIWQYIDTNPSKWQADCFYTP